MSGIPIGSVVHVKLNDAGVKAGATGRYVGIHGESGNLLIDVDGRGRVAFTRDQIEHPALNNGRTPWTDDVTPKVKVMSEEPKRMHRSSGVITVGDRKIALSISHTELADAFGIRPDQLKDAAIACGMDSPGMGRSQRYTAADIYEIHDLILAMAEFEVSAKVAKKIMAMIAAKEKGS